MSLLTISQSIQSIGFLTDIRESGMVYPVIMSTHLAGMAVFGGMIAATDMRLLGWGLKDWSVSDVVGQLRPWKRIGFVITATCGILLATSEAEKYHNNQYFWLKMLLFLLVGVHALVFRPTVYNNTEAIDKAPELPSQAKLAGALSLILWIGIVTMGRLIGYVEG